MIVLATGAFVAFGLVLVLVGTNAAEIATALELDLARTGLLGSLLALGVGVGVVAAGPLCDRFPRRPQFLAATLLGALAALGLGADAGFARLGLHLVGLGLGAGWFNTLLNVVVAERYAPRAARPLALVHGAATAGAGVGPLLLGRITDAWGWTASFHALGAALLAVAVWGAAVPLAAPRSAAERRPGDGDPRALLRAPTFLALAAVGFAYVGVETATTLFAVPYADLGLGLEPARGRRAIGAFWTGLLAGRIVLLLWRGRAAGGYLAACGALGAAVLAVAIPLGLETVEAVTGAFGIAVGGVYPVMISVAAERFPRAPGLAMGLVAGFGSAGAFTVPWLTGALGDAAGVAAAMGSLAAWPAAIAAVALVLRRLRPEPRAASPAARPAADAGPDPLSPEAGRTPPSPPGRGGRPASRP